MLKKVVMLVFLGTKRSWEIFWRFRKKSKKSKKMRFFRKKAYGLTSTLLKSRVTKYHNKIVFFSPKKNVKKKRFSFFETFFLKWKLDIYFCPFLKLKKKFWKLKNFPFSPSRWIYSVKWRVEWVCGGIFIDKNPTTYQKILRNREFHIFLQESRFRGIFW